MKNIKLFMTLVALVMALSAVNAQQLKPLKSFDGNEQKYLGQNFEYSNEKFKGKSFGELMKAVEVRFRTAQIYLPIREEQITIRLYLQAPGYVRNDEKELHTWRTTSGIHIYFEDGKAQEKAVAQAYVTFPQAKRGKELIVPFNKHFSDQISELMKEVKIKKVEYFEDTFLMTIIEEGW